MRRLSGCCNSARKSGPGSLDLVADARHAGVVGGLSNAEFDVRSFALLRSFSVGARDSMGERGVLRWREGTRVMLKALGIAFLLLEAALSQTTNLPSSSEAAVSNLTSTAQNLTQS